MMIRAAFVLFAVTFGMVSTHAMDTLPQLVRRASTTDASPIVAVSPPEPRKIQECVSTCSSDDGQHDRQLQLLPTIQEQIRNAINVTDVQATQTNLTACGTVAELLLALVGEGAFFNATVGDLFATLNNFPLLLTGLIVVFVSILAVLETLSLLLEAPILCIIGFANSITFGSCDPFLTGAEVAFLNSTFPDGVQLIPDNTTDAAALVTKMVDPSVTGDFTGYINGLTLDTVFRGIAEILGSQCRRRTVEVDLVDKSSEQYQHQCELELFTCEMNNVMAMLGEKK
jgi:hypothetical protein